MLPSTIVSAMASVGFRTNRLQTFQVDIEPFSHQDFNEKGFVWPWRIAKIHQHTRTAGLRVTMKDQLIIFFTNHTIYIRHLNANINKKLNTKELLLSQPIYGLFTVLYCGNSSMLFETKIILRSQRRCISTSQTQPVCVSRETRKPTPFPDSIKEIFLYAAHATKPDIPPMLPGPQSPEQRSYSQQFIIDETDLDSNGHTNNTIYIKFCFDVASKAITDGIFTHINHDMLNSKLSEFTVHFVGETREGDKVTFTVWQDLGNKRLLHFQANTDDSIVCKCQFSFNCQVLSLL
ncbi:uncharacterized protein LOC117115158 isoform X1 [Anneissia japonica]|uniref:uncharacterized protein LOC117115158 isoform X1 n=1 Tax=Anneissia japonica TaxID=1529436 RepID=UPI00142550B1|nr:uncharacterized protein LOC117115158 isoform X1 [Anneissia japonica]XP_033114745.1 uncharacterized protein LOC117115158 isoform X1 [Anneissia japonica]